MTSVGSVLYLAACLTAACCGAEDINLASHCLYVRDATCQRSKSQRGPVHQNMLPAGLGLAGLLIAFPTSFFLRLLVYRQLFP